MRPITPILGKRFSINSVRHEHHAPVCCVCHAENPKRTRTGTYYCDACAAECRAFVEMSREGDRVGLGIWRAT